MSEKNSGSNLPTKTKTSKEVSISQASRAKDVVLNPEVNNASAIEVKNLNSLSNEEIIALLRNKSAIVQEISRGYSEKAIPPGIYTEGEQTYWVCPKSLFTEDNIIGAMIYDLSVAAGSIVKTIDFEVRQLNTFNKKFIEGIWFGIFSSQSLKRRKGKQDYELGRACSFSLIVRSVFNRTEELGLSALIKDNFFYGNNPGETSNSNSVPFYIKMKLRSFFDKSEIGELLFGIVNATATSVGVSYLTEVESEKMIGESLIPIDSLISECYPTLLVKRGKKQSKEIRKPNPIRSSPLYTKDEIKIISDLTSSIFTELESVSKDYENCILSSGFTSVKKQIHDVINLRWETLQRFANQTKIRLQDIRRITGEDKLRKAGVKPIHVTALLESLPNASGRLHSEVRHILGAYDVNTAYTRAYKSSPATSQEAWALIYKRIHTMYENTRANPNIKTTFDGRDAREVDLDEEYRQAYNALAHSQRINGELIKNITLVRTTKYFKLYGRFKQIETLIQGTEKCYKTLQGLSNTSVDMAVRLYYEGLYKDRVDLNLRTHQRLRKALDQVNNHLTYTLKTEEDAALRKAAALFLGKIESVKASLAHSVYNS
jgi:hypothetical protein